MQVSRHVGRLDARRTCSQGGLLAGNWSRSSKSWIHKAESHPSATNLVPYYETCSTNKYFIHRRRNDRMIEVRVSTTRWYLHQIMLLKLVSQGCPCYLFTYLSCVSIILYSRRKDVPYKDICWQVNYNGTVRGLFLLHITMKWNSVTILMVSLKL
jgi:hypothetical protein